MPQPSGNRPQFAGDAPTQLLAPVGHDGTIRYVLSPSPLKGRYVYSPQDQPTAVIPVTPAQPEAEWDKPELPDCKKRTRAMGLLFGFGVLAGSAIAFPLGMVVGVALLMWKVLA